jgi:8-oxo-dGTP diphosphatase
MRGDREYPAHPLVGVGALIHDREGRVLLIKRKFEPNKGKWSLPGGLLETGENP